MTMQRVHFESETTPIRLPRAQLRFPIPVRQPRGFRAERPATWPRLEGRLEFVGGEILFMRELHAKVYLVDRREAIVASANLTRSGVEDNFEAGIWVNDPDVLKEICTFVDDLYDYGRS